MLFIVSMTTYSLLNILLNGSRSLFIISRSISFLKLFISICSIIFPNNSFTFLIISNFTGNPSSEGASRITLHIFSNVESDTIFHVLSGTRVNTPCKIFEKGFILPKGFTLSIVSVIILFLLISPIDFKELDAVSFIVSVILLILSSCNLSEIVLLKSFILLSTTLL